MEPSFEVTERSIDDVPVVSVAGEVDVATAPELRSRLAAYGDDVTTVVVDLSGVSFIDSTGLGVLVGAHTRRKETGGSLRLVVVEPRILKVLEITELLSLLPVFSTVDEAVAG